MHSFSQPFGRFLLTTGAGTLPSAVAGQRTAPGVSPARWVDAICRYAWSIGNRLEIDGRWEIDGGQFPEFQHQFQPNDSKGRCRKWGPQNKG